MTMYSRCGFIRTKQRELEISFSLLVPPLPIATPCAICFSFTELLSRVQLGICFQMLFSRVRTQLVVYQPVHVHVVILHKCVTLHVSV